MPKPQPPEKDHDQGSEASYYSYSEYSNLPASEISVNRRWYNRLDTWRKDITPNTPKSGQPDRLSPYFQPSIHVRRQDGVTSRADDVASTVSPKESISSRTSPRLGPVNNPLPLIPPFEQGAILLREEPRIMQDGRMDTVRVYDMGDGIEARVYPEATKGDVTPRNTPTNVGRNHLGLVPNDDDRVAHGQYYDLARNTRLPPSEGTFYTQRASQAGKLGPITEPYRMDTARRREAGERIVGYQFEIDGRRRTVMERDLPPLPPSEGTFYTERIQPSRVQRSQPIPPSFDPTSTPNPTLPDSTPRPPTQYRPVAPVNSAIAKLDTILERRQYTGEDKENNAARYRKGTPYPSVRNLSPSDSGNTTRIGSGDSESTVQRVIDRTTQVRDRDRPSRAAQVETFDPDKEEGTISAPPRKRYPDPAPTRVPVRTTDVRPNVSRQVSRVMDEPTRVDVQTAVSRPASKATLKPTKAQSKAATETKPTVTESGPHASNKSPAPSVTRRDEHHVHAEKPTAKRATRATNASSVRSVRPDVRESVEVVVHVPAPVEVNDLPPPTVPLEKPKSASTHKLVTREPSPAERRPEETKHTDPEQLNPPSASRLSPEERARDSSHGSAWTDTILSGSESRRRRPGSRDRQGDGHRSGSDAGSYRRLRRRSPSPPRRRISVQAPVGYLGANNVQPPFSAPAGGHVVHPPMIGSIMPNFRAMVPRPPVMPMVPRSRPAPIVPPPQQAYGWMGGMSPAAPMTGWMPQGPMSGLSPMNPMQNRASISAPPTGIGGIGGTGRGPGIAGGVLRSEIGVDRTRREGAGRSGQRRSSGTRPPVMNRDVIPQSSRRRRSNPGPSAGMPRLSGSGGVPRVPNPGTSGKRRTTGRAVVGGQTARRSGGGVPRPSGRPSGSRSRPVQANRTAPPRATGNRDTKGWVRNVLTLGRRPE